VKLGDILDFTAELAGCPEVPADSEVYLEADHDVRRVLFGIDIDVAELMWAKQAGFDAVIAHHPLGGSARTSFRRVVERQVDQMRAEGILEAEARAAVEERMGPRERALHMGNVDRIVDTGRLIGLPFCNLHLAADILARQAVVDVLARRGHDGATVGEALTWLEEFPEMEVAPARPELWLGAPGSPLGRHVVAMAGGTNGGFPVFSRYFAAGVDTILAMHIDEGDLQRLRAVADDGDNLVITGHMATDSIGINIVIRALEGRGLEVTRTSGIVAGR
jgi:putative NIF3 family GTP cyclohydrolase 1 type 2